MNFFQIDWENQTFGAADDASINIEFAEWRVQPPTGIGCIIEQQERDVWNVDARELKIDLNNKYLGENNSR